MMTMLVMIAEVTQCGDCRMSQTSLVAATTTTRPSAALSRSFSLSSLLVVFFDRDSVQVTPSDAYTFATSHTHWY